MRDQDQQHRRFELYTRAVQSPEREVELLARRFQRLRGRAALSLREDFAGTGATSQAWVESHDERTAEAVDHDEAALTHGRRRADHLDAAESSRLRFVAADMTRRSERAFDVIAAMNFSWAVLDDDLLDRYLRAAADCLEDDGVLALEYFGGPELSRPHQTSHHLDASTDYRFEVKSYRAPWMQAALHFEVDGRRDDDAFTYRFCLRSPGALESALERTGLRTASWLYEDRRGRYVARRGRPNKPLWTAVVLSEAAR